MKHLKIEGILEKRFEKINEAFDKARLHFHEDDIRVFRVKVKKLAACVHLIDNAKVNGHHIELPQKIVKLDQLFGNIRTLQMQQNYVQQTIKEKLIGSPDSYLKYISDQVLQHIKDASKHIKGDEPFKEEEGKLLGLLPKHLSREAILEFVRSEGDKLEKLFTEVFLTDKLFHQVRKHLKDLLYISPYIDLEMKALSPFKFLSSFEDIDAFTKILGDFHDLNTALDCLQSAVQKIEPGEDEKATLRKLEQIWAREKEALRVQIYDELQKITASGRTVEAPVEWVVM